MITRVRVKNYKSLADVDVELGPLTVLVGPNGSGKSNFIDALRFVKDSLDLGLESALMKRGNLGSVRRWSPRRPRNVSVSLDLLSEPLKAVFGFELSSGRAGGFQVKREFCDWEDLKFSESDGYEVTNGRWKRAPELRMLPRRRVSVRGQPTSLSSLVLPVLPGNSYYLIRRILTRMGFFSIYPSDLREPQRPGQDQVLDQYGRNLASVLRKMKQKHSPWWPELKAALQVVVDDISDVSVRAAGSYFVIELKHELGDSRSVSFDAARESDGTLRILGLLAAAYQDPPPTLLAIEEPELNVHPGATAVLCDVLREASRRTQVLLSTHSPDVLNRFGADEIRVVERRNGVTTINRVHPTQVEVINKKLFAPGELLQVEGLRPADQA